MSKKKLKKRIKELEVENLMLRAITTQPVYIYLYDTLPYRYYWQPYRYAKLIGDVTSIPSWEVTPDSYTWVINDGKYTVGDVAAASATMVASGY